VNRFIGPAEAGLLALGINTISGSLAQVLFTVARPLLVPIAARLDLENMNQSKRSLLLRVDATFALCVALTMIPLIALMPTVIGVWLGGDYDAMILPSQILVAGTAFTAGFNIRRSLLVGQGKGVAIVKVSLGLMLLAVGVFAWALVGARDWVLVTAVIAGFSALTSVLAVGLVFERHLLIPEARQARGTLRRTVAWSLAIVNAMLVSRMAPSGLSVDLLIPAIGSVLGVLVVAHLLVIPARDLISTLRTLKGGARRSLFADENGA
jgi:O-antigen/teichoic acid export membrane protein